MQLYLPKRIAGPTALTNVETTLYTAPGRATSSTVIYNIHVVNTDAATRTFNLSIGADAAGTRLYSAFSLTAGAVEDWKCYLVLAPGETLRGLASVTNVVTVTVSGVEVST